MTVVPKCLEVHRPLPTTAQDANTVLYFFARTARKCSREPLHLVSSGDQSLGQFLRVKLSPAGPGMASVPPIENQDPQSSDSGSGSGLGLSIAFLSLSLRSFPLVVAEDP